MLEEKQISIDVRSMLAGKTQQNFHVRTLEVTMKFVSAHI